MIGTQFTYEAPDTLKDVLNLIGREGYQVLTPDQSQVQALTREPTTLQALVSLRKVLGLATIRRESSQLQIGASASYADLLRSEATGLYPVLAQALATIPDPHLRYNCTLSGALHYGGLPHAPVLAALMALDATAVMLSRSDDIRLPVQSFSQHGRRVPFLPGRLLTAIIVPATHLTTGGYLSLEQLPGRAPAPGIAVALNRSDRNVTAARLVLAGFTEQPIRLETVETALVGHPLDADRIAEAADRIDSLSLPIANAQGPEGYYHQLAKVLIRRSLRQFIQ